MRFEALIMRLPIAASLAQVHVQVLRPILSKPHRRYVLRRRNIVARRDVWLLWEAAKLPQRLDWRGQ